MPLSRRALPSSADQKANRVSIVLAVFALFAFSHHCLIRRAVADTYWNEVIPSWTKIKDDLSTRQCEIEGTTTKYRNGVAIDTTTIRLRIYFKNGRRKTEVIDTASDTLVGAASENPKSAFLISAALGTASPEFVIRSYSEKNEPSRDRREVRSNLAHTQYPLFAGISLPNGIELYRYGPDIVRVKNEKTISRTQTQIELEIGEPSERLISIIVNPTNRWQIDSWVRTIRDPAGDLIDRGDVSYRQSDGERHYVERVSCSSETKRTGILNKRVAMVSEPVSCELQDRDFEIEYYGLVSPGLKLADRISIMLNRPWVWSLIISAVCFLFAFVIRRRDTNLHKT